jgi:hypothetical protein
LPALPSLPSLPIPAAGSGSGPSLPIALPTLSSVPALPVSLPTLPSLPSPGLLEDAGAKVGVDVEALDLVAVGVKVTK